LIRYIYLQELERSYNDFKERQKQEVKSVSRVHFDPFVQRRSTSSFDGSDITRTLEIRGDHTANGSSSIRSTALLKNQEIGALISGIEFIYHSALRF